MAGPANVAHPLIAPDAVARRDYQVAIASEALKRNTLVILPTGMGKTVVALLVVADRVQRAPGRVLLLAPTKPLVEQHARFLRDVYLGGKVELFTGETPPEERELLWRTAAVVCSTPQVVQNDLVSGRADLKDFTLVLFDEAHRASGNYAYVFIADAYRRQRLGGLVLGMTASPGANADKVREICENLGIEGVEVRTEDDADTRPYVQDTAVEWKQVAVPETLRRIAVLLRELLDQRVELVRKAGVVPPYMRYVGKKMLLQAAAGLQARIRQGEADSLTYAALSAQAAALKLNHALELVETQGVRALESYLERLVNDESKAAKTLLEDPRMQEVIALAGDSRVEHPKLRQVAILLRQQLAQKPDSRIIVFTNYRDTAATLVEQLGQVEGVRAARFVGQASRSETDKGLTQKKQVEMVERFKAGEHNVLVATSVAEEGLDIPATDLVIFYEPVASEIRSIQRRGRTGRRSAGRVVILITKDTGDETMHWASRGKEKKMQREIGALRQHFAKVNASTEANDWKALFTTTTPPISSAAAAAQKIDQKRTTTTTTTTTAQLPAAEAASDARAPGEKTLQDFTPAINEVPKSALASSAGEAARVTIVTDHREFSSAVVRELSKLGVVVKPETLEVGDYVLSDRVAVERKEADDFASSIMDGRLFPQARALRDAYTAPLMLVEGEGLLTARRISPEAVYGALSSLATDYRLGIVTTRDAVETARVLAAIARREQVDEKRTVALRAGKGPMNEDERLRYMVEGLPRVSAVLARRLLDRFGTVRELVNASVEELMEVEGVGSVIAQDIHRLVRTPYSKREER